MFERKNNVAWVLSIIGVIEIVAGVFCSFIFSNVDGIFSISLFLLLIISGILIGVLLFALSEIIELLHSNKQLSIETNSLLKLNNEKLDNLIHSQIKKDIAMTTNGDSLQTKNSNQSID